MRHYVVGIRGLLCEVSFKCLEDVLIHIDVLICVGFVEVLPDVFDEAIEDVIGGCIAHAGRDDRLGLAINPTTLPQRWFWLTSAAD